MFDVVREVFSMLDNSGPIARTMAAPYPIIDCEKMSASGLTCNSVINSNMEPPGNNNCEGFQMADHGFEAACFGRPLDTVAIGSSM